MTALPRLAVLLTVAFLAPHRLAAQCTGSIDLGPDTTLCTGQTIALTPGPGYLSYVWDNGSTGVTRMVSAPGTYHCTVQELEPGGNLVVNGDFSAGATGFTSGYIPGTGGQWGLLSNEGQYAVAANASTTHNNFPPCTDHTGGGAMMVVNGAATPGVAVWCQTVPVQPGTDYAFSAWLQTIVAQNPAILQFTINGQVIGAPFAATNVSCEWNQFYNIWSSGTNTTAEICITNQNTATSGNDFALDDISFTPFCTYSDTITVAYVEYPDPDLGPDRTVCGDGPVVLDATTPGVDTYIWNNGLATGPVFEVTTSGTYWVNVFDHSCGGRDSVTVELVPWPTVDLGPDRTACIGDSISFAVGSPGAQYLWHDGSTDPVWTAWASGEVWVQLANGPCTASDTVLVVMEDCVVEVDVDLPNIFTPNGDHSNGQFSPITMSGVKSLSIEVFNRWGQMVFTSSSPNFAWNGRSPAGEVVPEGTYFWVLTYESAEGPGERHGTVTLLR
jgi:gliding motility-associated-like protein